MNHFLYAVSILCVLFFISCGVIIKDASRDYVVSIDNTSGVPVDSIAVTQVTVGDTVYHSFNSTSIRTFVIDSSLTKVEVSFPIGAHDNSDFSVSYICYSFGVPVITSEGTNDVVQNTTGISGGVDSLVLEALKEYQTRLGDNDTLNNQVFDSLFIDYSLRDTIEAHRFYEAYKNRSGADTLAYLGALIDTLEKRDRSSVLTNLEYVLPPGIDHMQLMTAVAPLNTSEEISERLVISGGIEEPFRAIDHVIAHLKYPNGIVLSQEMEYKRETGKYIGFIDLTILEEQYVLEIMAYDSLTRLTGFKTHYFSNSSYNIEVGSFSPYNAKPWVQIDSLYFVTGSNKLLVALSHGDSLNEGSITSLEWKVDAGAYTPLQSITNLFTVSVGENSMMTVYVRVTDTDGNSVVDSATISAEEVALGAWTASSSSEGPLSSIVLPVSSAAVSSVANSSSIELLSSSSSVYLPSSSISLSSSHLLSSSEVVSSSSLGSSSSAHPTQYTETDIRNMVTAMSNEQKAAQLCMAGWQLADVSTMIDGGIGSFLEYDRDVGTFVNTYNAYQQSIRADNGIPVIHAGEAVHGLNFMSNAVIFPHNIGLGATRNEALVERVGEAAAVEFAAAGIRLGLSSLGLVARDGRWGRMYESFGEMPEIVAPLTAAYVRGLQKSGKVAATARHYVGAGGTTGWEQNILPDDVQYPIDRTDVALSESDLRAIYLPPYEAAVDAGVHAVMAAFNTISGKKIHGSKFWLTEVLKEELAFEGVVISEWNGMWLIEEDRYSSVVRGLNAGLDILMAPYDVFSSANGNPLYNDVLIAITSGDVPQARIDDAVFRVLRLKWKVGLFDDPMANTAVASIVGAPAQRAVARQAVRESMVLLKNEGTILPLQKVGQKIVVGGSHADNAGLQSGGWTREWQGTQPSDVNYEGATTIWEAMRGMSSTIHFDDGSNFVADADVAVIFSGEMPYAEGVGDRPADKLTLDEVYFDPPWSFIQAINPGDQLALFKKYVDTGIPVVLVLVSGRPLVVTEQIAQADAFMAAWLPGSEGAGVADVLFGDYAPTGRLPHTWPASTNQIPIHEGDGQTPLFSYGAGLGY